jgi:hypothetical protein
MLAQRLMWILWPAFLVAGAIEMLVFAFVEPEALQWFGEPLALSRQGIYTLAFFVFWALATAASAMTTLLSLSPFEVNRCPLAPETRPPGCPKREGGC